VLGKTYLTKQASLLLEFARNTSDSDLSAKLISKAADLKSQADPLPDKDQGPKAPDVAFEIGVGARDSRPSRRAVSASRSCPDELALLHHGDHAG
jgi:hypothetical protein